MTTYGTRRPDRVSITIGNNRVIITFKDGYVNLLKHRSRYIVKIENDQLILIPATGVNPGFIFSFKGCKTDRYRPIGTVINNKALTETLNKYFKVPYGTDRFDFTLDSGFKATDDGRFIFDLKVVDNER